MHFNGRFVLNLIQFASQQGADTEKLLTLAELPPEELCKEECKVGPEVYNRVVEAASSESGDPFYGLHAGEHLNLSAAGLIVQIAQTSETVLQALEFCCEFANLGCSALPATLHKEGENTVLKLTPLQSWKDQSVLSVQQTIYGYIAFMIREFHSLTRNRHYPVEVRLEFDKPDDVSELERVTQCRVKFNAVDNAIVFSKEHVELPVVTSDFRLLQVLVSHAQEKLDLMENSQSFYDKVKSSVLRLIKPEFPTIEQVAMQFNMSVRSFQRKLGGEGHTYKSLIDELRREFAIQYLRKPELSVSEVAYLLNYGDPSAFVRSFKRWTGTTPERFRNEVHPH